MKICLDYGHCLSKSDIGAQGNGYREEILARLVGKKVRDILINNGHTVIETVDTETFNSVGESLAFRYNKSNSNNADLFVSIHFNAYNSQAQGTEVYTYNRRDVPQARQILNNIVALGYTNRGIKDGSKLAVIKNTSAKSMLVECCFIDSKEDMERFDADILSEAIAYGIMGKSVPIKVIPKAQINSFVITENGKETTELYIGGTYKMVADATSPNGCTYEYWVSKKPYSKWEKLYSHSTDSTKVLTFGWVGEFRVLVYARDLKSSNPVDSEMFVDIVVKEKKLDPKEEMLRIRKELDNLIAKM